MPKLHEVLSGDLSQARMFQWYLYTRLYSLKWQRPHKIVHPIGLEPRSSTEWVDAGENGMATCRVLDCPTNMKWNHELSICSELLMELERLHDGVVSMHTVI